MTKLQDAALEELKRRIAKAGSNKAAAEELGVHPSEVSNALKGYRPMSESMLNALGFKTVSIAVPEDQAEQVIKSLRDQTQPNAQKKSATRPESVAA